MPPSIPKYHYQKVLQGLVNGRWVDIEQRDMEADPEEIRAFNAAIRSHRATDPRPYRTIVRRLKIQPKPANPMKIAILDYSVGSIDIIEIDENWLDTGLRNALTEKFTDEQWDTIDDDDRVKLFLYDICRYREEDIYYMFGCTETRFLGLADFLPDNS